MRFCGITTGVDIERFEVDSGELCLLPEQTNE